MPELISRLKAATEGSRELSDEVLLALGFVCHRNDDGSWKNWEDPDGEEVGCEYFGSDHEPPHPTVSVDDALKLVPEGWWLELKQADHRKGWRVNLWAEDGGVIPTDSATPALALCIAILKAQDA